MSNAIEIEAKALVSQEDYQKLCDTFKFYSPYLQTNYYIDNEDSILRYEGLSLRIREKEGAYEMTLKTPLSHGLLEKNEVLTEDEFIDFRDNKVFPENGLAEFLKMLGIDVTTLFIKTSLTTKRIDVPYKNGKLSLDENIYSGLIDYEIELEYNNEPDAERILAELFKDHDIEFQINKKTKVARALEAAFPTETK